MSKDKVEKGDVWLLDDGKSGIHHVFRVSYEDQYCLTLSPSDLGLSVVVNKLKPFIEKGKFLYKAKGSISDLFEVEDENS